jgi:phosphatidylglycerophosphate synthase
LLTDALASLCVVFALAVPGYLLVRAPLSIGLLAIASAALLLLVIFALVVHGLSNHHHDRFGYANVVTAVRAAIACILGAAVFFVENRQALEAGLPTVLVLTVIALTFDGLDGYLARRFRRESELGARFDMEIDALLILILSAAAFRLGKADGWVLLIGLMRYGFVLGQYALPRLRAPLAPSFRRKVICVFQVGGLCVVLVPMVAPPVSTTIAAVALALLSYSFAVDTHDLLRRRDPSA